MPDLPAQGSTADYCSRWPGEPHAISVHMRGGTPSVRRCDLCGWIDHEDLQAQAGAAYERGLAEHAAELARVQALLDHVQQRSIMVVKEARDAYDRGLAEGRRQAVEAVAERIGVPAALVHKNERLGFLTFGEFVTLVGSWEPAEQPEVSA